jgi:carbon-monoxide dehydrogenase small subunit
VKILIRARVNGEEHEVLGDSRDTLLEHLRARIGLSGTKEGCSNGNCGSCTVLVDGEPVNACLMLALEAGAHEVTTIEGVARGGRLDPIQQALIEHGGTQCGFCTPGVVLSAKALLDRVAAPSEDDIRGAIAGNLCRCTGYDKIVAAIATAARQPRPGG